MKEINCGVIYRDEDYVGIWRRIVIIFIDLIVLIPILSVGYLADSYRYEITLADNFIFYLYISAALSFLYLTIVKASKVGTLGQIITKSKIVNIKGKRPNIFQMSFRLLLWLFGPINFFFDLGFTSLNNEKRTMRDCLSKTIVVNKSAEPIVNNAEIVYSHAFVFGYNFLYAKAKRS